MIPRLHVCDLTTLFIDGGSGGGVNTYLTEKARFLERVPGVEHTILVPGDRDEIGVLHGARLVRVRSRRLPWNPEHRVLLRLRTVRRVLRKLRPDLVEVDCVSPLGRTAARAVPGTPILGTYHVHLPEFIAKPAVARLGAWLARRMERAAWGFVRHCTRPCERVLITSNDMLRRVGSELDDLLHVPLGVNTELFRPRPRRTRGRCVLLYVGRLSPEKHLEVLFAALRRLRTLEPEVGYELRLVGDGPERRRLERAALDLPVRFHGAYPYGPELAEIYSDADVFVNPSPYEAFGLANLEAAASGVPVVAIAQGGPLDVVTPEIGLLARPLDAEDLALRIIEVRASAPRFAGARALVEATHSWGRCFERLLAVYADLAGVRVDDLEDPSCDGHAAPGIPPTIPTAVVRAALSKTSLGSR